MLKIVTIVKGSSHNIHNTTFSILSAISDALKLPVLCVLDLILWTCTLVLIFIIDLLDPGHRTMWCVACCYQGNCTHFLCVSKILHNIRGIVSPVWDDIKPSPHIIKVPPSPNLTIKMNWSQLYLGFRWVLCLEKKCSHLYNHSVKSRKLDLRSTGRRLVLGRIIVSLSISCIYQAHVQTSACGFPNLLAVVPSRWI